MIFDSIEIDTKSDDLNYILNYTFKSKDVDVSKIKENIKIALPDSKPYFDVDLPNGMSKDEAESIGMYASTLSYTITTRDISNDMICVQIEWEPHVVYGTINYNDKVVDFKAECDYKSLNTKTQTMLKDIYGIDVKKAVRVD